MCVKNGLDLIHFGTPFVFTRRMEEDGSLLLPLGLLLLFFSRLRATWGSLKIHSFRFCLFFFSLFLSFGQRERDLPLQAPQNVDDHFPGSSSRFCFFSGGLLLVLNISPDISRDNFQVLKQKRIRKIFFQEITGDMPPPPPWCNGSGSAIASNLIKEQWILRSTGRDKEAF